MTFAALPVKKTYTWYISKNAMSKETIPPIMDWDENSPHPDYLQPSTVSLATYPKEWTDSVHASADTPRNLIWRNRATTEYFPVNINDTEVPVFKHWRYIDRFIFFGGSVSEGNIIAPDPWLVDLAHGQGVKIFGTVFLADGPHGGTADDIIDLTNNDNAMLKKIASTGGNLNIDGWFVNIESPSTGNGIRDRELVNSINKFLSEAESTRGLEFITYVPGSTSPYNGVNNAISDGHILNMHSGFNATDLDLSVSWTQSSPGSYLPSKQYLMFMDEPYWRSFNADAYSIKPFECTLAEKAMDSVFNGLTVGSEVWVGLKYYTMARQSPEVTIPTCKYAEATNLVNIAPYANVSAPLPGASNIERIVNMNTDSYNYSEIYGEYVQIDLKAVMPISNLKLWHVWQDARIYNSVVVLASNDPSFTSEISILFNNDTQNSLGFGRGEDQLYAESSSGLTIQGRTNPYGNQYLLANKRYLRFYSRGSNLNSGNHIVEVQVNVATRLLMTKGVVNIAKGKRVDTATQSGIAVIDPQKITDGIDEASNYALFPTGLVETKIDLGKIYPVTAVKVSRNKGAPNAVYSNVKDMLSLLPFRDGSEITIYDGPSRDGGFISLRDPSGIHPQPVNARYLYDRLDDQMGYSTGQYLNEIEVLIPELFNGTNYARGKPVTSSTGMQDLSLITDGETSDTNRHVSIGSGNQYIQIDLGGNFNIGNVKVIHYFGDGRIYNDVKVMVSTESTFSDAAVTKTVFDNSAGSALGSEKYQETSFGKIISFPSRQVRYIRLYSNGSDRNPDNQYVEVEAY